MDLSFCLENKILLDNNLKPQARQLQLRVDLMLKILATRVSGEVKLKQNDESPSRIVDKPAKTAASDLFRLQKLL